MNTAQEIAEDIARELRANPNAWYRGAFSNLGNCDGSWNDPEATAWCLSGHLKKRGDTRLSRFYDAFSRYAGGSICQWNDEPGRTVDEVIALCDRVAESA